MSDNNIRLQNLRDFTVQIRNAYDQIVGTGIAVSSDGKIVTCVHVLQAAGIDLRNAYASEIDVYFPQAIALDARKRHAKIAKFLDDYDDDVVLLQLVDGPTPLMPEQIAIIGSADESAGHTFRSYGYRSLGIYPAGWADGTIMGSVDCPPDLTLQVEPVQLDSKQISPGMSGSGVLDTERNLLVGMISETYYPLSNDPKDRDTAWSVNTRVLSLEPFGLAIHNSPLALKAALMPQFNIIRLEATLNIKEKYSWNNAPAVLIEWTGRDDLLRQITKDWVDPQKHITGLVGFGGEGKSSIARKWIDTLLRDPSRTQPDGVFWWGFYENRNVDEFLESALEFFGVDSIQYPSSNQRAQVVGSLLSTGRFIFLLDGLEVLQHQHGDQYGLLMNNNIRDLLNFFLRIDTQSFCVVTSRAPLLDFIEYAEYRHCDVDRLTEKEGHDLLTTLGVRGDDSELSKIVTEWDGHALTLSLLASLLVDQFGGDVNHLSDLPSPTSDEPIYDRVHRVLRRYDENLTEAERTFMKLFSLFRLPVEAKSFPKVFQASMEPSGINASVVSLNDIDFYRLVGRLVDRRILREFQDTGMVFTTHPLIRNHYNALFANHNMAQQKSAHLKIRDYYLSIAEDLSFYTNFEHLKPIIEAIYHACCAKEYDDALQIYNNYIQQGGRAILNKELGAFETSLNVFLEFFPTGDIALDPLTSEKNWGIIWNEVGFSLGHLGRVHQAIFLIEKGVLHAIDAQDLHNAAIGYQSLSVYYIYLGDLEKSLQAAREALHFSRHTTFKWIMVDSQGWYAYVLFLRGEIRKAENRFSESYSLQRKFDPTAKFPYANRGVVYAEYLRRVDKRDYARRVCDENLKICVERSWPEPLSQCHRVLGDLDADAGEHGLALAHYAEAFNIAKRISVRPLIIEALLARGRCHAKYMKDANAAFTDLNEAMGYCVESGYRIYEADTRIGLSWAYLRNNEKQKAITEIEQALKMSQGMGYYWAQVDAQEIMAKLK